MNKAEHRRLHALINAGLLGLAVITLFSGLRLMPKLLLVSALTIAAQRHSQKQELVFGDYQQAIAFAGTSSLDEVARSANWLKQQFPELQQDHRPKSRLGRIALDAYRAMNQPPSDPRLLYAPCIKKSLVFAANTREGKTVAAHYALETWADSDPDLIIYAFDKHLGMNDDPKFASNWLGIPKLDAPPKDIQTCAVKGKPKQLRGFLENVELLLNARIESNTNTPNVLVLIDEFSRLQSALSEEEAEENSNIISAVATESQKYGIFLWFICHSLTKEELRVDRMALRQAHIIMGSEMTQDRIQVSNSPKVLSADAVNYAHKQYKERGGVPAGFVTSLPVANGYLPPPPLQSLDELVRDWQPEHDESESWVKPLFMEFVERLSDPSVEAAIANYMNKSLDSGNDGSPKKALFRIVWGKPYKTDRKEMMDYIDEHLANLQASQNP